MKRFMLCITSLLLFQWHYSQNASTSDSLYIIMNSQTLSAEEKIVLLNDMSEKYLETDPKVAEEFARNALKLSSVINNKKHKALSCINLGTALYKRNVLDSAEYFCKESAQLYREIMDTVPLGFIYKELGNIEADKGNYEQSLLYYQKSLDIYEKIKDEHNVAFVNANIGALYINIGDLNQMYNYTIKALKLLREEGSKIGIACCLTNLSDYYFEYDDTLNIFLSLNEASQLFHEIGAKINEANCLTSLGDYYSEYVSDQGKAIDCYQRALQLLTEGDNNDLRMDLYRNISLAHFKNKDYRRSLEYAKMAEEVTDTSNIAFMQLNSFLLTYIYLRLGDLTNCEYFLDQYIRLTNQVYHESQVEAIAEMEVKYQTEKKEKEILQLNSTKKQRSVMIVSLFVFIVFGGVLFYFIIRNIRQKRIIAEQKVKELVKNQQLLAAQAILSGEETERRRLARDLHDGLGGLLSGLKLKLTNLKGDFILDAEKTTDFSKAIDILDTSVRELRRVAHNMMPEALIKLGLKDATSDFCSEISNPAIKIDFRFYGENQRIDQKIEISAFRIIQELVNNALKHSGASQIIVQIMQEKERLSISVQDNGKGFDPKIIDTNKSVGLSSIKSRVYTHNGIMDIKTNLGKGTEMQVEFGIY